MRASRPAHLARSPAAVVDACLHLLAAVHTARLRNDPAVAALEENIGSPRDLVAATIIPFTVRTLGFAAALVGRSVGRPLTPGWADFDDDSGRSTSNVEGARIARDAVSSADSSLGG